MNMKRTIITITYLLLLLTGTALSQTVEWKGITLLHSTRVDVEKLFGASINKEIDLYDTPDERITVMYSGGTCKNSKKNYWNVPVDTVVWMLVSPKKELNASVLKNKLNQTFEKYKEMEMSNIFIYYNSDFSIKFQTKLLDNGIEDVDFIAFSPGKSGENFRCNPVK
jgi:hypothetical protein